MRVLKSVINFFLGEGETRTHMISVLIAFTLIIAMILALAKAPQVMYVVLFMVYLAMNLIIGVLCLCGFYKYLRPKKQKQQCLQEQMEQAISENIYSSIAAVTKNQVDE